MTFDEAVRLTEILLGLAFLQQSLEHIATAKGFRNAGVHFTIRAALCAGLVLGIGSPVIYALLLVNALFILDHYQGPYNGGSDLMGLLILFCLCLIEILPQGPWAEYVFGYLALQAVLSYFKAGWVKIIRSEWRSGRALRDVFAVSVYPACEAFRRMADRPRLLWTASWAVMVLEVLMPLTLFSPVALTIALHLTFAFHLSNAVFLGFNRFVWFWLASYPAIFWFQDRFVV